MRSVCLYKFCVDVSATVSVYIYRSQLKVSAVFFELLKLVLMLFYYLQKLRLMLPDFAGNGHNSYTRSLYWFLQEMFALNPTVHEEFKKG